MVCNKKAATIWLEAFWVHILANQYLKSCPKTRKTLLSAQNASTTPILHIYLGPFVDSDDFCNCFSEQLLPGN